jgi:hypothetical protein
MLVENIEYPLDNLPPRLWGKNIFETLEIKTPPQIVKCEILVQHYFFKQTKISFFGGKYLEIPKKNLAFAKKIQTTI